MWPGVPAFWRSSVHVKNGRESCRLHMTLVTSYFTHNLRNKPPIPTVLRTTRRGRTATMPAILDDGDDAPHSATLPFPPVTKRHIMNCSYHSWWPKYKAVTPKSRLIPLTPAFLEYLRSDGIVLPDDEDPPPPTEWDSDSGVFTSTTQSDSGSDDDEDPDVAADWRDVHSKIRSTIAELGGKVLPKLNWSAPKDATWMNTNTMECRAPGDIYLLLKSSDFVTHDLEHAFDDTVSTPDYNLQQSAIPYHLVLRKAFAMNPSVEFRCFVRQRKLLCISQRDLNYYDFLRPMEGRLRSLINEFFETRLAQTFEDEDFVFDCYVPNPYNRVWLIDINPWAPRTDPILFSWQEVLGMRVPENDPRDLVDDIVRLSLRPSGELNGASGAADSTADDDGSTDDECSDEEADEELHLPPLRLVLKSDPEAHAFSTPQYSAHKLPRDVVEASQSGEGLREFAKEWETVLARRQAQDAAAAEDSGDD